MTDAAYSRELADSMLEEVLLARVLELAAWHGWRAAHFRPAQTRGGRWLTAVQAQGKGYPDLTLAHGPAGRLVFAELKTERGRATPDQRLWLDQLGAVAAAALRDEVDAIDGYVAAGMSGPIPPTDRVRAVTWRPRDYLAGTVEEVLRVSPADRAAALR